MADGSLSREIRLPAADDAFDVIYFAGTGGSSEGFRMATGRDPSVALNHNPVAIGVHQANFPRTTHLISDVFDLDPTQLAPGRKWRSFWASPDCRHHSKAKGSAPVSAAIRGLAWIVVKVAKLLGENAPDLIFLENVEEFADWCPLTVGPDGLGRPDLTKKGRTFRRWVRRLEQCGYVVEYRELVAADYGIPTTRKRLYLIARRDGKPIVWPKPTHAPRKVAAEKGLKPWRSAAECIDFSRPCPSIFLSREEARALGVKRPLEEATLRRIAKGIRRYVIESADPFVISITHRGDDRVHDIREPLRTVTAAKRGEFALVAPFLAPRYGERPGQDPRALSISQPYPTVVPDGNGGQLVAACLARHFGRSVGSDLSDPVGVVTPGGGGKTSVVAAFMEQANGGMVGHDARDPVSTILGKAANQRLVAATLSHAYSSNTAGGRGDPREPLRTVLAGGNHAALIEAELETPFSPHGDELRAFLVKYYGTAEAADIADPLHSVTALARFGLVLVAGVAWRIVDIGLRMLQPDELAAAQGFPRGYIHGFDAHGRALSKRDATQGIGNSVCPGMAAQIYAANLGTGAAHG